MRAVKKNTLKSIFIFYLFSFAFGQNAFSQAPQFTLSEIENMLDYNLAELKKFVVKKQHEVINYDATTYTATIMPVKHKANESFNNGFLVKTYTTVTGMFLTNAYHNNLFNNLKKNGYKFSIEYEIITGQTVKAYENSKYIIHIMKVERKDFAKGYQWEIFHNRSIQTDESKNVPPTPIQPKNEEKQEEPKPEKDIPIPDFSPKYTVKTFLPKKYEGILTNTTANVSSTCTIEFSITANNYVRMKGNVDNVNLFGTWNIVSDKPITLNTKRYVFNGVVNLGYPGSPFASGTSAPISFDVEITPNEIIGTTVLRPSQGVTTYNQYGTISLH